VAAPRRPVQGAAGPGCSGRGIDGRGEPILLIRITRSRCAAAKPILLCHRFFPALPFGAQKSGYRQKLCEKQKKGRAKARPKSNREV